MKLEEPQQAEEPNKVVTSRDILEGYLAGVTGKLIMTLNPQAWPGIGYTLPCLQPYKFQCKPWVSLAVRFHSALTLS